MTSWKYSLLVMGTALALTGCLGKAEPLPVVLGHVSTLSGPEAGAGERAARAIRLAVEEVNRDAERTGSRRVEVRHTDTRGDLAAFESEAVRLVTINRAVALLGGASAEEVERLERAHVPVVAPDGVRTRAMGELVFLTGLSPGFQGEVLARFAAQDLAATTAVVLADERQEAAVTLGEVFVREFPIAVGKQPAKTAVPRVILRRFSEDAKPVEIALAVFEAKAGVLVIAGRVASDHDLVAILNPSGPPLLLAGTGRAAAIQTKGILSNPVYATTAFAGDVDTPQARAFIEQYRKAFSEAPDVPAALAYDATRLLCEAVRQADNNYSAAQLREKLTGLKDFPGLTGPLSFGKDQQLRRPAFVVRLDNGQVRTIKRFDAAP
jgi:branched-chain amino acid transport system substrate-binding protein